MRMRLCFAGMHELDREAEVADKLTARVIGAVGSLASALQRADSQPEHVVYVLYADGRVQLTGSVPVGKAQVLVEQFELSTAEAAEKPGK